MMKLSTWSPVARRASAEAGVEDSSVLHKRVIYMRDATWLLRGVLADSQPHSTGPRLFRLSVPLFVTGDSLSLNWSEPIGDFSGTPEGLRSAEAVAVEILRSLLSERELLEWTAYQPTGDEQAPVSEDQAYACLVLGDTARFRRLLHDPMLLTPAKYANAERRAAERLREGRVRDLQDATDSYALDLLAGYRNAAVQHLISVGEVGPIETTLAG